MKITKSYLEKNLHKFHVPDEIPVEGVTVIGVEILHRNEINDDVEHSQQRQHDDISSRGKQIENSYRNGGIDFSKPLPIVQLRPDNKHDRIDSFGREAAWQNLGIDYYPYLVVKCEDYKSETSLRFWANRTLPKLDNAERDLVIGCIDLVEKKYIENQESDFRKWLKEVEPYRAKESIERVLTSIKDKLKTKQPKLKTWTYSDKQIQTKWVDRHWSNPPAYGFKISKDSSHPNKEGDVYQVSMFAGYEGRKILKAVQRYVETGKKTEMILAISTSIKGENL